MANKQTHEIPGGYMDGVRVKISEKYKPPPRIGLAMSYAQRLTLNKQIQDTIPQYEFLLEKTVIEKMREWKSARSVMFQELKNRLDKARNEMQKENIDAKDEGNSETIVAATSTTTSMFLTSATSQGYQQQTQSLLIPTQASINQFSNILTPIPLKEAICNHKSPDKSPFNISDFEPDTSSPFDNMALKSINDYEELAQVLNSDKETKPVSFPPTQSSQSIPVVDANYTYSSPNSHFSQPGTSFYNRTNGYYYAPETIQANCFKTPYNYPNQINNISYSSSPVQESPIQAYKSVPDIMKSLQTELDNAHIDNMQSIVDSVRNKSKVYPKARTKSEDVVDEFASLPKSMQDMSRAISSMGFPLSRVARVCKVIGNDEKKIVEHLLAMSELLDFGFPESNVSKALLQCDNDRDKALDILIS